MGVGKYQFLGLVPDKGWEKNVIEGWFGVLFVRESLVEGKRISIEKETIFVSIFVLDCCLQEGKKDIDRKEAIFISIFVLCVGFRDCDDT